MSWVNETSIPSHKFTCGHCGSGVASDRGYYSNGNIRGNRAVVHICPHCDLPSMFHAGSQIPGVVPGVEVLHLPNDVQALYKEARKAIAADCFTASVLISRKLLMSIAVAQGADPGLKFIEYVDYLASKGYVPPNGRGWVDHIRKKGNEATHEIVLMGKSESEELVSFRGFKFEVQRPLTLPLESSLRAAS